MKSRAGKRQREETGQKRKDQKKEDADARKGRKVAIHCVFPMICGSGGSKSRLAKAAGADPAGQMRDEKVQLWREAHFQVKMYKAHRHTNVSDHFWKLRCRKSARRCGAKHILKSKCTKHTNLGPLLEVEMSKKCTPLWREAHFQLKMYKTHQPRTTFGSWDVEKVHAVVARSTFASQNVQNTPAPDHFCTLRCRKSARRCGAKHISKSKVLKTDGLGPLFEVAMSKKCTPLWREAHYEVKSVKNWRSRTTFGSWDVELRKSARRCGAKHISKWKCPKHTILASFGSWDVEFRKSARRCGAKQISKSKCPKHIMFGPLLEVEMLKKCTPLWREAHFQVKRVKNWRSRTTFWSSDVEKVSKKCTPLWREAHFEVKSVKNWGFWAFFDVKMSKK